MRTELYKTAVRAIILDEERRILMGLRSKPTSHGYNQWALFGGKPERKESLKKATVRETKEETGLDIKVSRLFTTTLDKSTTPLDPCWYTFMLSKLLAENLKSNLMNTVVANILVESN